jgi:cyanophycin synthetase
MLLARDVFDDSTLVIREQNQVTIKRKGLIEQYELEDNESLEQVYLKEIATVV